MTRRTLAAALALALLPGAASAHLVSSGMGQFYDGLLHPLTSLPDLIAILGVCLWAGGRGEAAGRWTVLLLPLGWLAGGLLGAGITTARPWIVAAGAVSLLAGLAGAANLRLPRLAVGAAAGIAGILLSAAGTAADQAPDPLVTLGTAGAVGLLALLVCGQRAALRGPVAPVIARVLASWVAAASLLQLGWMYRGHGL